MPFGITINAILFRKKNILIIDENGKPLKKTRFVTT
jgi:hypothetical protein